MSEMSVSFNSELDPSQIASKVSWELCQGDAMQLPTVAQIALDLCQTVEAAGAVVSGQDVEEIPAINTLSTARRRMLLSEGRKRDVDVSKYQAIASYACRYNSILQDITTGKRKPSQNDVEQLRAHFATLSSILVEADL
jgi:hypothetical protein